jgi:hypothetical protein
MTIIRVKLRTYLADIVSSRNYRSFLSVKELLKRQLEALEDLTLLFTTL